MKTIKKIGIAIIIIIIGGAYAYGTWPRPIYNTDIGSLSYEKTDFLTTDSTMEQKFVCGNNGFSGFTIKMLKQDGQNIGNYRWTVEEVKTGKTIGKGTYRGAKGMGGRGQNQTRDRDRGQRCRGSVHDVRQNPLRFILRKKIRQKVN